jgi:hypothetical protein
MVKAMVAPDADVIALFPKGELRSDTHSSSEECMLGFVVAAGVNTFLAQTCYECVRVG